MEQSFDRPIPGMSMTHEVGARPWQTPPSLVTVEEATDYYVERMGTDEFKQKLIDVMEIGVPLTVLANTIQLASVMEGLHSVDVGMLMIPILVETMMLIGDSAEVKYVTGMEETKGERPAMVEKILNNIKNTKGVDPNVSIEKTMEEPQEMPMDEEPKGLMARRG